MTPCFRTPSEGTVSLDSKRLSDLLAAMSTPQVVKMKQSDSTVTNNYAFHSFDSSRSQGKFLSYIQERGSGAPTDGQRGSWASFDLRNCQPDPPIAGLLDHVDAETVDQLNEVKRRSGEHRQDALFSLYPPQPPSEIVERRSPGEEPREGGGAHNRILVQCNKMELALQVEPIFASMALYDAKEKKKVSENFYFDMNPEQIRRMLEGYVPQADYSTQARSCIFDISQPTQDLFLVVKLEKVLQGDISESAEPYLKDSVSLLLNYLRTFLLANPLVSLLDQHRESARERVRRVQPAR